MKLVKLLQLSFIMIITCGAVPALAGDALTNQVVSTTVKTEADRIVQEEILPTLRVEIRNDGQTIPGDTSTQVNIQTTKYIGLEGFLESKDDASVVTFSGDSLEPETVITIIFPTNNIRSSVMADAQGRWSIEVPVNQLSAGRQQAMLQTIHKGVRSNESLIAEFDVATEETLSNSTWVFLFSSVLAILCLLFAITLQLRHNMRGFSTDPLM